MTDLSPRMIEKLEAIGYQISTPPTTEVHFHGRRIGDYIMGARHTPDLGRQRAWKGALIHAESLEGMKITMADKVRWLSTTFPGFMVTVRTVDGKFNARVVEFRIAGADSPEAAVHALWESVP